MKTAIFCRVSSKEQEETGYSLPAQEKFLREYADKQGLEVSKVFAISESAAGKSQRKVFLEMVAYVRKHNIPTIIVETTDRLTRNFADVPTIDLWIMENQEHQIHLAKEACILHSNSRSHEWFMWRVKVATAEYYVRLLSENVKKGQKEKIAQGWFPSKPPVGYKTVGEQGHKIVVIDEVKAPIVRKMFELYATGNYSLNRVTETMYQEGLRSYHGVKLVKSRIHSLLRDPFYLGKLRWTGIVYDGKHEAIITTELFNKVQDILKGKTAAKMTRHDYLFNKMIHCSECGGQTTWESQKGRLYGHCNHYRGCTQKTWMREDRLEEQLIDAFDKLSIKSKRIAEWLKKALKDGHQDELEYHTKTVDELNAQYKQIKKRLGMLYDDKLDEKITLEFYTQKSKQYNAEKDKILETVQKHSNASTSYLNLGISLYELSQRAKDIYLQAKEKGLREEQRCLIRLVFSDLKLDEGVLHFQYSKAFKILADAIRETNGSNIEKIDDLENGKFELTKKHDISTKKDALLPLRPTWLPR